MSEKINKPTLKTPSDLGKSYEKSFKKENPMLEVDDLLTEKEVSLKKKIFSLAKMESLVHADPKLSAIYDDMAINGEEKYGYHYNETIMNMIFNDYVLNSAKYLQKYKNAIPKKKKRRDKSGINQLKAKGEKEMVKRGLKPKTSDDDKEKKKVDESVETMDVLFYLEDDGSVFAYFPNEDHDRNGILKTSYSHVGQHSACSPDYVKNKQLATPEQYEELRNELENQVGYNLNILNDINETTTTAGVGGSGMGSGGYETPHAWGDGDLMKGKKSKMMKKPIWSGGVVVGESDYLTNSDIFENYIKELEKENTIDMKENRKHDNFKRYARDIEKGIIDPEEFDDEISTMSHKKQNKQQWDDSEEEFDFEEFDFEDEYAIDEHHLTLLSDKITYIRNAYKKILEMGKPEVVLNVLEYLNKENIDMLYHDTEQLLQRLGVEPKSIDHTSQLRGVTEDEIDEVSMIDNKPETETMANKVQGASMEMGMNSGGGMSEDIDELLENIDKELKAFEIHQKSLEGIFEERKTSSMINKDRMGVENKKNFKSDLKHSGTKEVIDIEKELQWKDQQEVVGDNPKKFSEEIEKDVLKRTKGEALKNVGDSTNKKGDEIPKRNHTEEEQEEIDLYREGMHSLDYDTTNDRFEERVKEEMGEKLYDQGRKQVENRKNRPMYNKDSQPVHNEKINESIINGFYVDTLNKRKIVGFKPKDVQLMENVKGLFIIDFTGMGNAQGYMGQINEGIDNYLTKYNFYTDGEKVYKKVKSLNESTQKETSNSGFNMDKISHLMNYNPNDFTNTKGVKSNRGF